MPRCWGCIGELRIVNRGCDVASHRAAVARQSLCQGNGGVVTATTMTCRVIATFRDKRGDDAAMSVYSAVQTATVCQVSLRTVQRKMPQLEAAGAWKDEGASGTFHSSRCGRRGYRQADRHPLTVTTTCRYDNATLTATRCRSYAPNSPSGAAALRSPKPRLPNANALSRRSRWRCKCSTPHSSRLRHLNLWQRRIRRCGSNRPAC